MSTHAIVYTSSYPCALCGGLFHPYWVETVIARDEETGEDTSFYGMCGFCRLPGVGMGPPRRRLRMPKVIAEMVPVDWELEDVEEMVA